METVEIDINEYKPHPQNPNTHPDNQLEALGESLEKFDQVKNIVVWRGHYLAGHGLVEAAKRKGLHTLAAVDVSEWEEEQAVAFMLADNRLPALAIMDEVALADLLAEMDNPLEIPGFDEDFLAGLDFGDDKPPIDVEPQIDKAAELQEEWGTELGQVWQMGEHRLAVGDCTDRGVVERVMGEDKARMIFTDPPYNVNYGSAQAPIGGRAVHAIANDNMTNEDWLKFQNNWMEQSFAVLDNATIYICMSAKEWATTRSSFIKNGGHWSSDIIWVKSSLIPGRKDYHSRYEALLYGWLEGEKHYWCGDTTLDDVWEIQRHSINELHPTQKPILLVETAIRNSSKVEALILDPFLGSGTTLIACEQLNRRCRGIEINPGYAAVTLQRFLDTFNTRGELLI